MDLNNRRSSDNLEDKRDVFITKVVPIMDKVMADLRHKQVDEIERHSSSPGFVMAGAAGPDGGMTMQTASLNTLRLTGKWNSKTTEDYLKMVEAELKKQNIKVDAVIEKKMIDYLIDKNVPKSSLEYILKEGIQGSLLFGDHSIAKSPLDGYIRKESEKRYDSSTLESVAAFGASLVFDAPTLIGPHSVAAGVSITLLDLGTHLGKDYDAITKSGDWKISQAKKATDDYKAASNEKVSSPLWMAQKYFGKDAKISNLSQPPTEEHLDKLSKALQWAAKNGSLYSSLVEKAIRNGERTITVSGKMMSVHDATIRSREYFEFSKVLVKSINSSSRELIAKNVNRDDFSYIPTWMFYNRLGIKSINDLNEVSDDKLQSQLKWAEGTRKVFEKELDKATNNDQVLQGDIKVSGKKFSFYDTVIKVEQYKAFEEAIKGEQKKRVEELKIQSSQQSFSNDEVKSEDNTQKAESGQSQVANEQYGKDGWGKFFSSLGLSGAKDNIFGHLGYTLAMLPDMLFGAFTGKTKSLGANEQTLVPLGAMLLGLFVKNPILKLALVGLGGANLLNKLSSEANSRMEGVDNSNGLSASLSQSQFLKYENQDLNPRITNLTIENGVMYADVDKVPVIVPLTMRMKAAYEEGSLPLNTLANSVLPKLDELRFQQSADQIQQNQVAQTYDRNLQQDQGIKIK